ncbi:hypothetical protein K8I31_17645, partial [bacterium]|nr:hypothetical protein [bacterium]
MEVSGLQITEYPFDIDRKASISSYLPGEVFDTNVNVTVREGQTVSSLTITENVPPEATSVSNISDGGVLSGDTITWNLSNVTGSKSLSYTLTAPSDINVASMNWTAGSASGSGM